MNKVLIIIAMFIVIAIPITIFDGVKEKQQHMADSDLFIEYRITFDEQRYEEAYTLGKELLTIRQDEDVYYMLALSSYALHNYDESVQYFEAVIDKNVNRLAQPLFLLQFADALIAANEVEDAKKIVKRAKQIAPDEQFEHYIESLEQMMLGGGKQ